MPLVMVPACAQAADGAEHRKGRAETKKMVAAGRHAPPARGETPGPPSPGGGEVPRAKDVQEVLTLQSRYAQTQMQTFGIQAQQLSWLMADAVRNMQQPKA